MLNTHRARAKMLKGKKARKLNPKIDFLLPHELYVILIFENSKRNLWIKIMVEEIISSFQYPPE